MIGTKSSAVTLVTLLFMTPMSGCLGGEAKESPFDSDHWLPDVEDRSMSVLGLSTVNRTCSDLFLPPMQEPYPHC